MSYSHTEMDGVDVIELYDSIDLYSAPETKKFMKKLLKDSEQRIIITMEKVIFLDSSGLGMLVNFFFECKKRKILIKLANLSKETQKILKVTKLTGKYETHATLTDAMKSFE